MRRRTAALAGVAAAVTTMLGCASVEDRGRAPVDLDACSIERAACRERCSRTAVHTFSCRVRDGVVVTLECDCEPTAPVEDDRP